MSDRKEIGPIFENPFSILMIVKDSHEKPF
jgi:hypothetical protein